MSFLLDSRLTPEQQAQAARFDQIDAETDQRLFGRKQIDHAAAAAAYGALASAIVAHPAHPAADAWRRHMQPSTAPLDVQSMFDQIDAAEDALVKARNVLSGPFSSPEAALSLFHEAIQFLACEHEQTIVEQRNELRDAGLRILDANRLDTGGKAHYTTVADAWRTALAATRVAVRNAGGKA